MAEIGEACRLFPGKVLGAISSRSLSHRDQGSASSSESCTVTERHTLKAEAEAEIRSRKEKQMQKLQMYEQCYCRLLSWADI